MFLDWEMAGRTYWLNFGFDGNGWVLWRRRVEAGNVIPSVMYRFKPVTLTIFDGLISSIKPQAQSARPPY
jgi:hypothetical protein